MAIKLNSAIAASIAAGLFAAACGGSTPPAETVDTTAAPVAAPEVVAPSDAPAPAADVPAPAADAAAPAAEPAADAKECCKGKNECKGKGACKTDKNACKGKNDCKGHGGCKANCPK